MTLYSRPISGEVQDGALRINITGAPTTYCRTCLIEEVVRVRNTGGGCVVALPGVVDYEDVPELFRLDPNGIGDPN